MIRGPQHPRPHAGGWRRALVPGTCLALAVAVASALALAAPPGAAAASSQAAAAPRLQAPAVTPKSARPPQLSARAAILVEASTGTPVYRLHARERMPIASTTKLMTALLALEHERLRTIFTAAPDGGPADEARLGLVPGERISVADLLRAMLLPSAGDAAVTLADGVGGSTPRFVRMMNRSARRLGLARTHYANPVGLDQDGNYSTAADLARLAIYLRDRFPFVRQTTDMPQATLDSGDVAGTVVVNRNTLVSEVPWVNGVKTGHTLDAGYVLVGSGTRDGETFVSVVLGTPSEAARDADTLALLRYGFATFHRRTLIRRGARVRRLPVAFRSDKRIAVVPAKTRSRVLARRATVRRAVDLPDELRGPLPRGAVVGHEIVRSGGRIVASSALVTARAVPEVGPIERAWDWIGRPSRLVPLAILIVLVGWFGLRRRGRPRQRAAADRDSA